MLSLTCSFKRSAADQIIVLIGGSIDTLDKAPADIKV
jgi:hypothetical protein